jgi:uncharacterized RDD family membrane protein YckC
MPTTEQPPTAVIADRSGYPAGVVTRGLAYAVDIGATTALYSAGVWGGAFLLTVVTGGRAGPDDVPIVWLGVGWALWWIVYFGISVAYFGRTLGKGLLGLRVLRPTGDGVGAIRAIVRAVAVPLLLAATVGVDALVAALSTRRRAIHDHLCSTVVVYDWPTEPGTRRIRLLEAR